ncbi:MAG: oligosaccharide flippase family protein, partial [bacterium]|nr:oligosaccharide flippase family protein [bacterium]
MVKTVTITKNSLYSLVSSIIQKAMTLVYFIIVARAFGPSDQGRYSAALAFTTLFNVLIDLGVSSVLTRETARAPQRAHIYVSQMFISRIGISILVYGIIIASASLLGYSQEFIGLVTIAGLASIFDALSNASWAVFRGLRNLFYESIGGILAIAVMIIGGMSTIALHLPITFLMYSVLAGSLV